MHPNIAHVLRFFEYGHLPAGKLRDTSKLYHDLAHTLVDRDLDGPELTVALRKLLESKDAAVRAALPVQAVKAG